jgi:hypothetical protein
MWKVWFEMSNKDESSLKDERRGISARDGKTPGRKGRFGLGLPLRKEDMKLQPYP